MPCVWHVYSTDFVLRCTSSLSLLIFSDMQHLCCPWPLPKRHRSSCDSSDTSIPPCRRTSCDPENAPSSRNHCRITDPHIPHPAHRTPHTAQRTRTPPTANRQPSSGPRVAWKRLLPRRHPHRRQSILRRNLATQPPASTIAHPRCNPLTLCCFPCMPSGLRALLPPESV